MYIMWLLQMHQCIQFMSELVENIYGTQEQQGRRLAYSSYIVEVLFCHSLLGHRLPENAETLNNLWHGTI